MGDLDCRLLIVADEELHDFIHPRHNGGTYFTRVSHPVSARELTLGLLFSNS